MPGGRLMPSRYSFRYSGQNWEREESMSKNNFSDLGRQLQQIVQDALRTQDFTKLKNTIHTTVDTTVKKVKEET